MIRKSFVSIFFSPKTLQILQLDGRKKKVKNSLSVDLPEGIIKDSRVSDTQALANIINTIWKKQGIRERFVGIVVPEFSTLTKSLTLPELELDEIDEAVRWQAEDFLPSDPEKVVLDWKIIKEENNNYQILTVSIEKEILEGYVKSVELAGLFPLVVETPSLSLARVSNGKPSGKLILYETFGDAILVIAQGEKIMGSSVADTANHEELIKIASRMVQHYREAGIDRVVIGGARFEKVLADKLQSALNRPVEWIDLKMGGLATEKLQEYLIPISLQLKDPTEPSDENTINLLPSELVKKYENEKLKLQVWSLTLFVTLVVWFTFLSTLGFYVYMGQQIEFLKRSTTFERIPPEKAEIISQIKEINQVSNKVIKIVSLSSSPEKILNTINQTKPFGIIIKQQRLNLETGEIEIKGISSTRQALLDFKTAIEAVTDFSLVSIPISSFESEGDSEFRMSFTYLPVASKKPLIKSTE